MQIGSRIKAARKAKGITQEALARELGVAVMTVSRWERDDAKPPLVRLQDLADALDITVRDLLTDSEAVA